MKKITALMLFAAAGLAQANPADELLSAQAAFRQALSAQNSTGSEIANLQSNLTAARARAQQAQADVARYEGELQTATAAKAQNDAALQYTQFSVSKKKREAVIDEVSKAALKRFQARADTLVQTLGFRGYKIVHLNLGQIGNQSAEYAAAPMMMRAAKADSMGGMPETTNPGTEEIRITVNGTIQM